MIVMLKDVLKILSICIIVVLYFSIWKWASPLDKSISKMNSLIENLIVCFQWFWVISHAALLVGIFVWAWVS